jgi:hypothetical protein
MLARRSAVEQRLAHLGAAGVVDAHEQNATHRASYPLTDID